VPGKLIGEPVPYKVGREVTMATCKQETPKPQSLQLGAWRKGESQEQGATGPVTKPTNFPSTYH